MVGAFWLLKNWMASTVARPKRKIASVSFAQDLLARNNPAVRVSDTLAGEIDENFKAHLVRLLKLCGGDDGELGLALLHGQHTQVGGPDNPKINITFGLKADISKPQPHREIRD